MDGLSVLMMDDCMRMLRKSLKVLHALSLSLSLLQFHSPERQRTATRPPSPTWQPSLDYISLHRPVWTTLYEYGPTTTTLSGMVATYTYLVRTGVS